jgi:hypothetical protein
MSYSGSLPDPYYLYHPHPLAYSMARMPLLLPLPLTHTHFFLFFVYYSILCLRSRRPHSSLALKIQTVSNLCRTL